MMILITGCAQIKWTHPNSIANPMAIEVRLLNFCIDCEAVYNCADLICPKCGSHNCKAGNAVYLMKQAFREQCPNLITTGEPFCEITGKNPFTD
jgi:hypothetical protein